MTILEAIQQANSRADIRTLIFANIKEFQSFIESFNELDYPANIVIPFDVPYTMLNGRRKSVIPIQGWMMTRLQDDTTNFKSVKVEELYLQPMRELAFKFIKELTTNQNITDDLLDPEEDEPTGVVKPEYAFLSARIFGVSYTINLPITEAIC